MCFNLEFFFFYIHLDTEISQLIKNKYQQQHSSERNLLLTHTDDFFICTANLNGFRIDATVEDRDLFVSINRWSKINLEI